MARCEWNPTKNEAALLSADEECFNEADVSLGNGKWHVCDSCAALPRFAEFKERRRLQSAIDRDLMAGRAALAEKEPQQ